MPTTDESAGTPAAGRRPLEGIRVLDASTVIAAPLAAMILGDFGAEVIKVEHPTAATRPAATGTTATARRCGG